MRDADYADDLMLLANTPLQAESLLHVLAEAVGGIILFGNADETECIYFKQKGAISTLRGKPLELMDQFTFFVSNISFTENMY